VAVAEVNKALMEIIQFFQRLLLMPVVVADLPITQVLLRDATEDQEVEVQATSWVTIQEQATKVTMEVQEVMRMVEAVEAVVMEA
jgi:hypothetical protein